MLKANQANYMADDKVVFVISINGDHKPSKIKKNLLVMKQRGF